MNGRALAAVFFRNDLEYAPFGTRLLKGVTPARLCVGALFTLVSAIGGLNGVWAMEGLTTNTLLMLTGNWAWECAALIPLILLLVWVDEYTARSPLKRRVSYFAAAVVMGASLYVPLFFGLITLAGYYFYEWGAARQSWVVGLFYFSVVPGALFAAVLIFARLEREASRDTLQARLARIAAERQAVEARLQLLRAQIEPHFLFNSLASVKRLYEHDAVGGRSLLRNMSAYLRSAISRGREREATLGEEVAMVRAYLDIFRERMGERLQVRVDVPSDLHPALVPPLMLGTLVENAVKHGIGPKGAGGFIAVRARREGDSLVLEVEDDGRGFVAESGTGVGLANTRARLESLSNAAELGLRRNSAGGVTASIRLPLRFSVAGNVNRVGGTPPQRPVTDPAPAAAAGFHRRFLQILGWKHWLWAVGIALVACTLGRLRMFASPLDHLGILWLEETVLYVTFACLFMLALVVVEASCPEGKQCSGRRYLAGCLTAAVLCGWIQWNVTPSSNWSPAALEDKPMKLLIASWDAKIQNNLAYNRGARNLFFFGTTPISLGLLGSLVYVWLRNSRRAAEALSRAEIERKEAERRLIASQIEMMESEVDPGFIFGTLEAIESMYERDRAAADAMLDELIAFLRAAIPKLRTDEGAQAPQPEVA